MNNFKEIQNLISEDKIYKVDDFFYFKVKQKIKRLEGRDFFTLKIKKIHIICSVAAGLLVGIFLGSIVQHHIKQDNRILLMENVLSKYYLNEMKYECVEYNLLNGLYEENDFK